MATHFKRNTTHKKKVSSREQLYSTTVISLISNQIYMAPSRNARGIFLLDFHPSCPLLTMWIQYEEDQTKQVFHESGLEMKQITAIKWNPVDQNEVGHAGRDAICVDFIGFNPSNQRQLAFHLNTGWSGVFNVPSSSITHIHRPHALAGLDEACRDPFYTRRCSWLSNTSIYMAPSRNERGIFLLDFHRSTSSPYHVDSVGDNQDNNRGFVALSHTIITCSAHPQYDDIVAGTERTSLLVISQMHESAEGDDQLEEGVGDNVDEEEDVADEEEGELDDYESEEEEDEE